MDEHKCNSCSGCGFKETVDAEVVKEIKSTSPKERVWNSFLLFLLPVLIILGLVLALSLAIKVFFYLLPILIIGYIALVVYRIVKK